MRQTTPRAFFILASLVYAVYSQTVCNIEQFGAKPAPYNSTASIAKAIGSCCASQTSGATILVPSNVYLSGPQQIQRCPGITLQLDGQIQAPEAIGDWPSIDIKQFLLIDDSPGATIRGSGSINGSGFAWWQIRRKTPSHPAPYLVLVEHSDGASVRDVRFIDSPKFHLVVEKSSNITIDGISVSAPFDSPNTDAIDLGEVTGAVVQNAVIANGDDGVAIKAFTTNVLVQNCTFYGGHGTSIGSLGETSDGDHVSDITFRNLTFHQSWIGTRIKTWQGRTGYVTNITFQDVVMHDVQVSIRINQYYCPHSQHPGQCKNSTTKGLNVTGVLFKGLSGTQTSGHAGELLCSDPAPCHGITLEDVHIEPSKSGGENEFECWEVHGEESDVFPDASGCMWEGATTAEQRERGREGPRWQEFDLESVDQGSD